MSAVTGVGQHRSALRRLLRGPAGRAVHLTPQRRAALLTAAAGTAAVAVQAVWRGPGAALVTAVAVATVLVFFGTSGAAIRLLDLAGGLGRAGMLLVLVTYLFRLMVVLLAGAGVARVAPQHTSIFGGTLLTAALVWALAVVLSTYFGRRPLIIDRVPADEQPAS